MSLDLADRPFGSLPQLPTVTIRRAFPEDTDLIFPLQRLYELEEVYLNPAYFDDRRCRSLLRRSLREQIVYVAEIRGKPVAKAGTNAQGFGADQIGGVFTVPRLRGTGLGRTVMTALLDDIGRTKTHACLFVKKENVAACRLYERLGFQTREDYRITYYERF
jgi:predicted GNAT family acetyltransferase